MRFDLYYIQSHAISAFVLVTLVLLFVVVARIANASNIVALPSAAMPVLLLWVFVNTPIGAALGLSWTLGGSVA